MRPKAPNELNVQVEAQNPEASEQGPDKSAEGIDLPRPLRSEFFGNLDKLAAPEK